MRKRGAGERSLACVWDLHAHVFGLDVEGRHHLWHLVLDHCRKLREK